MEKKNLSCTGVPNLNSLSYVNIFCTLFTILLSTLYLLLDSFLRSFFFFYGDCSILVYLNDAKFLLLLALMDFVLTGVSLFISSLLIPYSNR